MGDVRARHLSGLNIPLHPNAESWLPRVLIAQSQVFFSSGVTTQVWDIVDHPEVS